MNKEGEDYYINTRGCSRETARTYLRTENSAERKYRLKTIVEEKDDFNSALTGLPPTTDETGKQL